MFLASRTPLRIGRPIGKPFLEPGRMVGTCRWIWIQSGSEQLFSQSNVGFLWCSKVMSSMTFILSGFSFIPQLLTMKPKNFPAETPKAHLVGFNFML